MPQMSVHGSSPPRTSQTGDEVNPLLSDLFTPPADSLLVVCFSHDSLGIADSFSIGISDNFGIEGSSLAWTEHVSRDFDEGLAGGTSKIWTARTIQSIEGQISVLVTTAPVDPGRTRSIKVYVLTGLEVDGVPIAETTPDNEGSSTTNNLTTTSLTPDSDGLLICVSTDWNALGDFEASSDLTQETTTYTGLISVCSGYKSVFAGVPVTANLNAAGTSSAHHKWCQILVRHNNIILPSRDEDLLEFPKEKLHELSHIYPLTR